MPVRWCRSTTSLKTTSHRSFFPPMLFWPGRRASLNPKRSLALHIIMADGGAGFCLPGWWKSLEEQGAAPPQEV